MLSSADDAYIDYLQHLVTEGPGIDVAVVREALRALGFGDKAIAHMLGETASCGSATTSDVSTGTAVDTSASLSSDLAQLSAVAPANEHDKTPASVAGTPPTPPTAAVSGTPRRPSPASESPTVSSGSTSSPATSVSQSVPSAVPPASAPRPGQSAEAHQTPHAERRQILPAAPYALPVELPSSVPPCQSPPRRTEQRQHRLANSEVGITDRQGQASVGDALGDGLRALPSAYPKRSTSGFLSKLESMHALLAQISFLPSSSSSERRGPCQADIAGPSRCDAVSADASSGDNSNGRSSSSSCADINDDDSAVRQHCCRGHPTCLYCAQHRRRAAQDITSSDASTESSSHARAGATHADATRAWHRALPPPLLTVAQDAEETCRDGRQTVAMPLRRDKQRQGTPSPPPPRVGRARPPAFAQYREELSHWVHAHRPTANRGPCPAVSGTRYRSAASASARAGLAGRPTHPPAIAPRAPLAAVEPHVHSISMKPSVKELVARWRQGATRMNGSTLPTTLSRHARSDPVAIAARYRQVWTRRDRRVQEKKDTALWETRRRLIPSD